jgi:uncharacterized membrane protein YjfL (UPF0719 family)
MQIIITILCFWGLGLLGLGILIASALRSRSATAIVSWGLIAMVLLILESMLLINLAGIGSATSTSQTGYKAAGTAVLVFLLCEGIYFPLAFARLAIRKRSEQASDS